MRDALRVILVALAILVIGVAAAAIAHSAGLVVASDTILKAAIWLAAVVVEVNICIAVVRIAWLGLVKLTNEV